VIGVTEREALIAWLADGLDLPPELTQRWIDPNPPPGSYEAARLAAMAEHEAFVAGIDAMMPDILAEMNAEMHASGTLPEDWQVYFDPIAWDSPAAHDVYAARVQEWIKAHERPKR
jgi:hypothetical protein